MTEAWFTEAPGHQGDFRCCGHTARTGGSLASLG
jgi:hypothetical protein